MKILILTGGLSEKDFGGVEYHRLIAPFNQMGVDGFDVTHSDHIEGVEAKDLRGFDVCVFSRNISPRCDPLPVFAELKAAGVKIVVDIDDYWYLDKDHVLTELYQKTNMSRCIIDQIKHADMVWTTHKPLARKIKQETSKKKVIAIPNGIDPENQLQFKLDHNTHDYNHLFYQGSVTHYNDLKLMSKAVNDSNAKITLAGYTDIDEWNKCKALFKNVDTIPNKHAYEYATGYYDKGIALVPLRDTTFNRMKSELKMIEAGWFSKAVIVSDVYPYTRLAMHEKNCLKVDSDWGTPIKRMLESRQLQDDLRGVLHENVKNRYMIKDLNKIRIESLIDLCSKKN